MHMRKIRVVHKDGDMQGITLMYLINMIRRRKCGEIKKVKR
jgi:hypothetical protein